MKCMAVFSGQAEEHTGLGCRCVHICKLGHPWVTVSDQVSLSLNCLHW